MSTPKLSLMKSIFQIVLLLNPIQTLKKYMWLQIYGINQNEKHENKKTTPATIFSLDFFELIF